MRNARLNEAKVGNKFAERNINDLIYVYYTILIVGSKEELKNLLVKEESEKADLKLGLQKMKNMASSSITSWPIDGETMDTVRNFIFLGSKINVDDDCSHEIKRCLLP